MKLHKSIAALALFGLLFCGQPARAADVKIGQVDLKKIFEGFYKTKIADTQLKERAADSEKVLKGMLEDFQKAREDYKKLVDGANDQAVSADERDKRKKSAETKLLELQEIERSVQQFRNNTQDALDTQKLRMRTDILKQIREVINDKAKKAGYTMVFDTAAQSRNETEVILYTSGINDFTDEVLTEINKDAPAAAATTGAVESKAEVRPLPDILNPKKPLTDGKK